MSAMLKKAFEAIRGYRDSVEAEIDRLEARREDLKRNRDQVRAAPRPREEAIADIERVIDVQRDEYARRLEGMIGRKDGFYTAGHPWWSADHRIASGITQVYAPSINLMTLPHGEGNRKAPESFDQVAHMSIVGLLADAIKPTVRSMVEAMEWPADTISAAERTQKIAALDKEIADVSAKLAELLKEAEDAGVQF